RSAAGVDAAAGPRDVGVEVAAADRGLGVFHPQGAAPRAPGARHGVLVEGAPVEARRAAGHVDRAAEAPARDDAVPEELTALELGVGVERAHGRAVDIVARDIVEELCRLEDRSAAVDLHGAPVEL